MAKPVITIHDSLGAVIAEGTPLVLPTATPGTPTAETVFSVRNNDAAGPAVETAPNVKITITGRLKGAVTEPAADGLAFLVQRALQLRVTAVSGGATADIVAWRSIGTGLSFSIKSIPDGGVVTMGQRTNAPLPASLSHVELFIAVDMIQSTPLPEGSYRLHGNAVYDGKPGGKADPLFTMLRSETGAWSVNGPADDTINTPTTAAYTLKGVTYTYSPLTPAQTFSALDGDAATLIAGEAYYVKLSYNSSGTLTVTKGSKAAEPLVEADEPATPDDEFYRLLVTVPFGLAVDTIVEQGDVGFFAFTDLGGLDCSIGPGMAFVGERWVDDETVTDLTLADDSSLTIWLRPEAGSGTGLEVVTTSADPTDPWSMPLWDVVTVSGDITSTTDRRVIGLGSSGGADMSRFENLYGSAWDANADLALRTVVGRRTIDITALTGNVTVTTLLKTLTGSGTAFTTELAAGGVLVTTGGQALIVASITDNTNAVLQRSSPITESGVSAWTSDFQEVKDFLASDPVYADNLSRRTADVHGASPLTIEIASTSANDTSAGTGARTAIVTYLDATGAEVVTAPLSMSGQTPVSVGSGLAVNAVEMASAGSNGLQEGDVYVGLTGTFTAGVPADVLAKIPLVDPGGGFSAGRSAAAVFCVPLGKLAQITSLSATPESAVELRIFTQGPSAEATLDGPIVLVWSGLVTERGVDLEFDAPITANLPAQSYVFARATTRSAGPTDLRVQIGIALLEV